MKTPIELLLDKVDFKPLENVEPLSNLAYATHSGKLKVFDTEIEVIQLNTGQRIIPESEINRLFGKDFLKTPQDT